MTKLITVVNQKGGVGKTTVACHLAFEAAERGYSVLVVDMDTQGNASHFLSQDFCINEQSGGAEQLFEDLAQIQFKETPNPNISLLHGHIHLEALDNLGNEFLLDYAINSRLKIRNLPFDYVIFDTPPTITPRQLATLIWSDLAVVVTDPKISAVAGMKSVFDTISSVRSINKGLSYRVLVNLFVPSSKSQKGLFEELSHQFGSKLIGEFHHRVAVSDALTSCIPVWELKTRNTDSNNELKQKWKSTCQNILNILN